MLEEPGLLSMHICLTKLDETAGTKADGNGRLLMNHVRGYTTKQIELPNRRSDHITGFINRCE